MTTIAHRRTAAVTLTAVAAASVLAGCGGAGARLTFPDVEKVKVTEIVVAGRSGDVLVRTAPIAETRINRKVTSSTDPGVSYRLDGTVLTLNTDCGPDCGADFDVEAPAGVTVRGGLDSGDIGVTGVAGADLTMQSGHVMVREAKGPVKAEVTSGDIDVLDSTGAVTLRITSGEARAINVGGGPVDARSTSGDVTVHLSAPESVSAHTTSGDVTVMAPAGDYRVQARADSGEAEVFGLRNNPSAETTLLATADSGDVRIATTPAR